jgi:hypothetical protein
MLRSSLLPRHVVLVTISLASLLVFFGVGCRQDVGERCEQDSDCYSGYCTGTGAANPGMCQSGPTTGGFVDASVTIDAGSDAMSSDAGDAVSDATSDIASDGHVEAGAEVSEDSADGALESHVEAGGDVGTEAGSEAGSEVGTNDAASGG